MKKMFIALLLVPMLNAQDVFLECKRTDREDPIGIYTLNIQVMLDKQLVKMHQDIKFRETSNGVINWTIIFDYTDDLSMARIDYYLDRKDLSLNAVADYISQDKEDDLAKYQCVKLETQF